MKKSQKINSKFIKLKGFYDIKKNISPKWRKTNKDGLCIVMILRCGNLQLDWVIITHAFGAYIVSPI